MTLFDFLLDLQLLLFYFSKALTRGEYVNLACSITLFWSGGNISSPLRYSYLIILSDDNADSFTASLLVSYRSFSALILSSVVIIGFYILSKRFFLKREEIFDVGVVSVTKTNMVLPYFFVKIHNFLKVNT